MILECAELCASSPSGLLVFGFGQQHIQRACATQAAKANKAAEGGDEEED